MQAISYFFRTAKRGCREFADYVLGWGSARRWLQDCIPFGDCEKHKRFLEEKFRECIFAPEDLEKFVEHMIKAYLKEVEQIKNQMLLELQEDVADLPVVTAKWDQEKIRAEYAKCLIGACQHAKKKLLYHDTAKLTTSTTSELLAHAIARKLSKTIAIRILNRLGLQLGTKAVGIASGTVTLGIGLILGMVLDYIIEWIFDFKGGLAQELADKLDELEREISNAVKAEFRQLLEERSVVRQAALQSLFSPSPKQDQE